MEDSRFRLDTDISHDRATWYSRITWRGVVYVGLLSAVILTVMILLIVGTAESGSDDGALFTISQANIMTHLRDLEAIAVANGNTRAVGTPGFVATVQYVYNTLKKETGNTFTLAIQDFNYTQWVPGTANTSFIVGTTPLLYGSQYLQVQYGGNGVGTDVAVTFVGIGCNVTTDFAGFPAGNVALIQRGVCYFRDKISNAVAAGASLVVLYDASANPDDILSLTASYFRPIPVFSTSVNQVAKITDALLSWDVTGNHVVLSPCQNIIATSKKGDPTRKIIVGSHTDSVPAGPGINDNGSGSSTILEAAIRMHKSGFNPVNQVEFAWFGAEEIGLLGSYAYVAALTPAQIANVAMMFDYDMLGSPNWIRGMYLGNTTDLTINNVAAASQKVTQLYVDYYKSIKITDVSFLEFDGRSDYDGFILVGIPAGGLFTGAEGVKTMAERSAYGGLAKAWYDPCYHASCDTVENINTEILQEIANAVVATLKKTAMDKHILTYLHGTSKTRSSPADIAAALAALPSQSTLQARRAKLLEQ